MTDGVSPAIETDETAPPLSVGAGEFVGLAGLLVACILMSIFGEPFLAYTDHTADWLNAPADYIGAVLKGGGR